MSQLAHLIGRLVIIIVGLLLAFAAAAAVTFFAVLPAGNGLSDVREPAELFARFALLVVAQTKVLGALGGPLLIGVILVAETGRFRHWLFYLAAAVLCAASGIAQWETDNYGQGEITIVMAAALVAGGVYWLIAGRSAGFLYERAKVSADQADRMTAPGDEPN